MTVRLLLFCTFCLAASLPIVATGEPNYVNEGVVAADHGDYKTAFSFWKREANKGNKVAGPR